MRKRLFQLLMLGLTVFSIGTCNMVLAAEDNSDENIYSTDVNKVGISSLSLDIVDAQDILVATVPVELPIVVDTNGNVTVPEDAKIVNKLTDKRIQITQLGLFWNSDVNKSFTVYP